MHPANATGSSALLEVPFRADKCRSVMTAVVDRCARSLHRNDGIGIQLLGEEKPLD
jgi:hypothetical protein